MANQFSATVETLRKNFATGKTKNVDFRLAQLQALERLIKENLDDLARANSEDLHKSVAQCKLEISGIAHEAGFFIANLKKLTEPEKVASPGSDEVFIVAEPYGVVLVISPWNFPIHLTFGPLFGAIAGGNSVLIKPSEIAPKCEAILSRLIPKYLDSDFYKVVTGGVQETTDLLKNRFDYIFFTGAPRVGKIVHQAAANFLTPVTLELGGKSPVYIDDKVDVEAAAKRIIFGKIRNVGQICVAPDYVLCSAKVQEQLVAAIKKHLADWFGDDDKIAQSGHYGRIINDTHFRRVSNLLDGVRGKIAYGGQTDPKTRFVHPTVVVDVTRDDLIMQEEIFGPVLPIVRAESVNEAVDFINRGEKPLALYVFSDDRKIVDAFVENTSSGGLYVNDVLVLGINIPFGGVGNSGMGAYHGKYSFDTFVHRKGVVVRKSAQPGECDLRYALFNSKI